MIFGNLLDNAIKYGGTPAEVKVIVDIKLPNRDRISYCEIIPKNVPALLKKTLIEQGMLSQDEFEKIEKEQKEIVIAAMKFADESPWPDLMTLEQGVFAPEGK